MRLIALILCAGTAAMGSTAFQPGFHQALRGSVSIGRTTYTMKLPIGRGGGRLRVSFKAGDGSLTLHSASIAHAGTQAALSFDSAAGFSAGARQRVQSDPVAFPVAFGDELFVSFDVEGALAASNINAFPGSTPTPRAIGLDTIDVEGEAGPAFVALGDSITEGYVSGDVGDYVSRSDDYRNAWTTVAQNALRLPVANAAVSGQGLDDATAALDSEVFTLQGITDCLVLIGTNDLWDLTADQIDARMATLFDRLRPFCRVWAGTLLPKEVTTMGDYATVVSRRLAVNAFIRTQAKVDGIIDFEAALAAPGNVNAFVPGYGEDGIHPSIAGQQVMGKEAARVLAIPRVTASSPATGPVGTSFALTGSIFPPGTAVTFAGIPAQVSVTSSGSIVAIAPADGAGTADIVVTSPQGASATLAGAFTYQAGAAPPADPADAGGAPAPSDADAGTLPAGQDGTPASPPALAPRAGGGCNNAGALSSAWLLVIALAILWRRFPSRAARASAKSRR
jgi:lysophospholipase L1-like esterase